jgi:hypothetical protein
MTRYKLSPNLISSAATIHALAEVHRAIPHDEKDSLAYSAYVSLYSALDALRCLQDAPHGKELTLSPSDLTALRQIANRLDSKIRRHEETLEALNQDEQDHITDHGELGIEYDANRLIERLSTPLANKDQ